ncbi:hypothetical protein TNCV_4585321 [Trichonephila clavipes]|nr:hypothetical protein TNCV_4585321 [Trichonephila clavipes]
MEKEIDMQGSLPNEKNPVMLTISESPNDNLLLRNKREASHKRSRLRCITINRSSNEEHHVNRKEILTKIESITPTV